MTATLPQFPVYIVSKGRWEARNTSKFLELDDVPYRIVVEPQEVDSYAEVIARDKILVLPFSNLGQGSIPARNWIWQHSISEGHEWHWILDDNIRRVYRLWYGERIPCDSGPAFRQIEDFALRFSNLGIAGMNYKMFGLPNLQAFFLNTHVYSCLLIRNELPFRWRGRYNEDTDLCLQALSSQWCTVLVNVFLADKLPTMTMKGGNSDELYKGDGRLDMAKHLQAQWGEELVKIDRRWQRPQHVIDWRRFKTPLIRREGIEVPTRTDDYGLVLRADGEIKGDKIKRILHDYETREAVA